MLWSLWVNTLVSKNLGIHDSPLGQGAGLDTGIFLCFYVTFTNITKSHLLKALTMESMPMEIELYFGLFMYSLKIFKWKPKNSKYIYLQERAGPAGDTAVPWNKCVVSFLHAKINRN